MSDIHGDGKPSLKTRVLILIAMLVAFAVWGALSGAIVDRAHSQETTTSYRMPQQELGTGAGVTAKITRKWNHDRLGHSTGRKIFGKVARKLAAYDAAHRTAAHPKGILNWWENALSHDQCQFAWTTLGTVPVMDAISSGWCRAVDKYPTMRKINARAVQVRVVCGGYATITVTAAIFSRSGFVAGVGAERAADCLWDKAGKYIANRLAKAENNKFVVLPTR